jgi:hypothetical protein
VKSGACRMKAQEGAPMNEIIHYKFADMTLDPYDGPPGEAKIARLIGPEENSGMGAGL